MMVPVHFADQCVPAMAVKPGEVDPEGLAPFQLASMRTSVRVNAGVPARAVFEKYCPTSPAPEKPPAAENRQRPSMCSITAATA